MIRVNLYHIMPSDTWAFAYRVPWHVNVVGLVAGLRSCEHAKQSVDYISKELAIPAEYMA